MGGKIWVYPYIKIMTVNSAATGQIGPAERAQFVVEHSSDVISVHRPDGWIYVEVNQAITGVMGFEPEEVLGKPALDFFHPEDAETFRVRTAPLVYSNGVYTKQYRLRHKEGHYFWVESTHRSIRDAETGKLLEIICVTRDLTARVKAEQENRRLAAVVQASSDLVLFFDDNHRILYANASAEKALGSPAASEMADMLGAEAYTQFVESVWPEVLAQGHWTGHLLFPFAAPGGTCTAALHQVLKAEDEGGDLIYSMAAHDLTDLLRAQEEARRHKAEISKISRQLAVGEMATVLAHEVNQPLGTIANYAHGALRHFSHEDSTPDKQVLQLFERIARQADRAGDIVQRLRSIVGRTVYREESVPINDLCRQAAAMMDEEIRDARISIALDLAPTVGSIRGDRVQIEQVIVNLLQNAVQALAEVNSSERRISIGTRMDLADVLLSIHDTGPGIGADKLESIFDSFHTTRKNGLGLGLPIARSIVEAHRGSIWATSDETAGTAFFIRLPMPSGDANA